MDHVASIRVGRFLSRAEAEVARGLLASNDIEAVVLGDDGGGVHPDISYGYGGVALGVHPDDVAAARELLDDLAPPIARDTLRSPGWRPRAVVGVALVMMLVMVALAVQQLTLVQLL